MRVEWLAFEKIDDRLVVGLRRAASARNAGSADSERRTAIGVDRHAVLEPKLSSVITSGSRRDSSDNPMKKWRSS